MDIPRAKLEAKRQECLKLLETYQQQMFALQGAVQMIDELLVEPKDALTMDDLRQALGAQSVGEPQSVEEP